MAFCLSCFSITFVVTTVTPMLPWHWTWCSMTGRPHGTWSSWLSTCLYAANLSDMRSILISFRLLCTDCHTCIMYLYHYFHIDCYGCRTFYFGFFFFLFRHIHVWNFVNTTWPINLKLFFTCNWWLLAKNLAT